MPNSSLVLDKYQRQVIDDLAIDAWYLEPLKRENSDPEFLASQENISELLEQITTEIVEPPSRSVDCSYAEINNSIPTFNTDIQHYPSSESEIFGKELALVEGAKNLSKKPDSDVSQIITSVSTKITAGITTSIVKSTPKSICLNPRLDFSLPVDTTVNFSVCEDISVSSIDDIRLLIYDTADKAGVGRKKAITGQGSYSPELFIIAPPPLNEQIERQQLLNESEQQLLDEVLFSAGVSLNKVYITPLIKQAIVKHQDPDSSLQDAYLPILAAEIALLNPKKIIILGRVASQVILKTKAPLRELMSCEYMISLGGHNYSANILPSLEYFFKIPSEKYHLWQLIKTL